MCRSKLNALHKAEHVFCSAVPLAMITRFPSDLCFKTNQDIKQTFLSVLLPVTPQCFMPWVGINKISAEFQFFL